MSEILKKTLERKFKIKVPYSVIEKKMEENFLELSKNLKISGFRPGKIPISFVKNKYHKELNGYIYYGGIEEEKCTSMLKVFFKKLR